MGNFIKSEFDTFLVLEQIFIFDIDFLFLDLLSWAACRDEEGDDEDDGGENEAVGDNTRAEHEVVENPSNLKILKFDRLAAVFLRIQIFLSELRKI